MKILIVHNRYQQKGGEDAVALSERNLLASNGQEVELLEVDNDAIVSLPGKIAASISVFYSRAGVRILEDALARFRPDVVHVHNWFPTLSPAIFWVCRRQRLPVVQTLHNYRLLCAGGSLFRDGHVCEDCIGTRLRSPGVMHGCYRGSRLGTGVATAGMLAHWRIGTWHKAVNRFIALSQFARNKLIQGGLPAEKVVIKPNLLDLDPGFRPGKVLGEPRYLAFVGRLTEDKGVGRLLDCWSRNPDLPLLRIIGTGPLEERVREAAGRFANLEWLGMKYPAEVVGIMGGASALLCPSLWYEGMPRVVIEALAVGTPVLASRLGTYPEMIVEGKFGELFDSSDPEALTECVRRLSAGNTLGEMRAAARNEFEARYTAAPNFQMLQKIYQDAMADFSEAVS